MQLAKNRIAAMQRLNRTTAELHPAENDVLVPLWRILMHPAALALPATLALLLALAGMFLPQMPDQLRFEPASAERWLAVAASESGTGGQLWRSLGLHTVATHPALMGALVLLALSLAARFAHALGVRPTLAGWAAQATVPVPEPGLAVRLTNYLPLYRTRYRVEHSPQEIATAIGRRLVRQGFTDVTTLQIGYGQEANAPVQSEGPSPASDLGRQAPPVEQRVLVVRHAAYAWFPVLRDGGLLLATVAAWSLLAFGWSVTSPVLAPGERFQTAARAIAIDYPMASAPDSEENSLYSLRVVVRTQAPSTNAEEFGLGTHRRGNRLTNIVVAAPGMFLEGMQDLTLRRLGQAEPVARLGLILSAPNSEETVLLSEVSAGLRLVRPGGEAMNWIVEYYAAGDLQPRARWEVDPRVATQLDLPDLDHSIRLEPAVGIQATIRHMPGHWLLWVGLLAASVGVIGSFRKPLFAVIQAGPWRDVTVVTVQTTEPRNGQSSALWQAVRAGTTDTTDTTARAQLDQGQRSSPTELAQ